ncbi:MAG: hypothetical protein ACR2O2_17865 [Ruegeria sp.]
MHYAAQQGQAETALALVNAGADVHVCAVYTSTAV